MSPETDEGNAPPIVGANGPIYPLDDSLFPDPGSCLPPLQPAGERGWNLELQLSEIRQPLNFTAIFGRTAPTYIEIGFGSGIFLCEEAKRHTGSNYLAIEKDCKQVRRARDKWCRRNLLNIRALRCDAFYFLEEYVVPASVDGYIILYSDPWFKNKHHKRRVFQPRLLPILERTLKPGASLRVKTDITPYYEVIVQLLDKAPFLKKLDERRLDLAPLADDIETNYQRKARAAGHPLHSLVYERRE